MEQPISICDECFEKNRVTHPAGGGDELLGAYCTHSRTGAQAARNGDIMSKWNESPGVAERSFWHLLRLTARLHRGEITPAQLKVEVSAFARKNGNR